MNSSNWPQNFDTFLDPTASTRMNDPNYGHAGQHTLANDAINNIEHFLGATPNFNVITATTQAGGVLTGTFSNLAYVDPPLYGIPFTKTGTLTVTAGALRFPIFKTTTILGAIATVNTAPQGTFPIILDITKNGTSIYTTTNNRPTIAVGTNISQVPYLAPNVSTATLGDYLQVNILQVGDSTAGSDLTVVIVTQ